MTREYPPEVYGGAGVHVTELVAQLRHLCEVDVHCMGAPRPGVFVHQPDPALKGANPALSTLSADLNMVNGASNATVVHSHTWYTGLAGHLAALLYGIPHVLTAHSLEPMRPWKAEQLGGGYRVSSWVEKTAVEAADAVIAVSSGMRDDVLRTYPALDPNRVHVVKNGIDTDVWYPVGAATRSTQDGQSELGARRTRRRPESPDRGLRRADHPAEGGRASDRGGPPLRARDPAGAVRRRTGHPGDRRRGDVGRTGPGSRPQRRVLGSGDAADRQDPRNTLSSNSFRMPIGVRTVGHCESGGDGLRDGGGGLRCRRHTGGGRGPSDGSTGALQPRATRRTSNYRWPMRSTRWWPILARRASTARRGGSAVSKNFPGRTSPSRPWRSTERCLHRFRRGNLRRAHASAPKASW